MSKENQSTEETTTQKRNPLHSKFGGLSFLILAFLLLCLIFQLKNPQTETIPQDAPQLIAITTK